CVATVATASTKFMLIPKNSSNLSQGDKPEGAFKESTVKVLISIPIIYHDERYTSVLAHRAMIEGGLKKSDRQDKSLVDMVSATIILQSYMSSQAYMENNMNNI
ncbi:MAG: Holliday junction resolvase RuvX, partial [Rikenellaceae bacterium]